MAACTVLQTSATDGCLGQRPPPLSLAGDQLVAAVLQYRRPVAATILRGGAGPLTVADLAAAVFAAATVGDRSAVAHIRGLCPSAELLGQTYPWPRTTGRRGLTTALMVACWNRSTGVITELLLDERLNVAQRVDGHDALMLAIRIGTPDLLGTLVAWYAARSLPLEPSWTAAFGDGNVAPATIEAMLRYGVSVNTCYRSQTGADHSILERAATNYDTAAVDILMRRGATGGTAALLGLLRYVSGERPTTVAEPQPAVLEELVERLTRGISADELPRLLESTGQLPQSVVDLVRRVVFEKKVLKRTRPWC